MSIAATRFVAMRVEFEPMRAFGNDTEVAVMVQIAPEDRRSIGRRALLQVELKQGETTIDRTVRSIDIDANGQARFELLWPPGVYDVRVDIEGSTGDNSGIWMGKVRVPRFEPEEPPAEQPPTLEEEAEPPAAAAGTMAAKPEKSGVPTQPQAPESSADQTAAAASAGAGAAAVPQQSPSGPPSDESEASTLEVVRDTGASIADWGAPDADLADITAIVTDRSRPILGLGPESFRLRVSGKQQTIRELATADDAPLFLGIAIDMSVSMTEYLPELSRLLSRLVLRTLGDDGGLLLVTGDTETTVALDWGASPADMATALQRPGSATEIDIAEMVSTGVESFAQRRGRKFLIVVTDGGQKASPTDWKQTTAIVEAAGVPVFVVGLRGDPFRERTRRQLEGFSTHTGGKHYFLSDAGLLRMTFDYLTDLIGGSYALRFDLQRTDKLHKVNLSTAVKGQTVLHPKTIR
jgi:VWFA-related protein